MNEIFVLVQPYIVRNMQETTTYTTIINKPVTETFKYLTIYQIHESPEVKQSIGTNQVTIILPVSQLDT